MIRTSNRRTNMPKRFNDKNRSIFVRFHEDATEKEIRSELASLRISGFRVSNLINRWVLEVPFWKEEEFSEMLAENEFVERLHPNLDRRRQREGQDVE
jgi:hypothetical protein